MIKKPERLKKQLKRLLKLHKMLKTQERRFKLPRKRLRRRFSHQRLSLKIKRKLRKLLMPESRPWKKEKPSLIRNKKLPLKEWKKRNNFRRIELRLNKINWQLKPKRMLKCLPNSKRSKMPDRKVSKRLPRKHTRMLSKPENWLLPTRLLTLREDLRPVELSSHLNSATFGLMAQLKSSWLT